MPSTPRPTTTGDPTAQAAFLMAGLAWQDTLLQAYRNYLLVTQSIFLAVNVGLLTAQASAQTTTGKLVFWLPFFTISAIGLATLMFLSVAVRERTKSVDWWQRRLLRFEKAQPDSRSFTTFRVAKEHQFRGPAVEAHTLEEREIETLLRPDIPKARRVFGIFVPGFAILWFVLLASAVVNGLSGHMTK